LPVAALLALLLCADPTADYDRGRALAAAGDLKGAAEALKRVTAAFPGWGLAQIELAEVLLRAGGDEVALDRALTSAVALEPLNPRAWLLRGRSQEHRDAAAAAVSYSRAVELRPELVEPHERLAALLLASDRLAEAAPHLRAVVAARPEDRTARANLADALERAGDLAGAEAQLRALVEAAPRHQGYRRRLIDFCERNGQAAKATEEKRRADALEPGRTLRPLPPSGR
jgi:predicted Zn-dependent protease